METLLHSPATRGLAPIPASERGLTTVTAEPFFIVSDVPIPLEGPSFDRVGNLLFLDIPGGRLLRLTPSGQLDTLYSERDLNPSGVAVHKDGRIFLAACGPKDAQGYFSAGSVLALSPDGTGRKTIVEAGAGHVPNDIVFDCEGGIYMSDFRGDSTNPIGGVFYLSPDLQTIKPVLKNLCAANGVALSPDGKVLWATEYCACKLHRAELSAPGQIAQSASSTPYQFIGPGPDSMRTDEEGNVYVAMNRQGRVLVFSPYGIPIAQILLPGREKNHFLRCTSLAIRPFSRELFIVARDEVGGGGSVVFKAGALAEGHALFSHQ